MFRNLTRAIASSSQISSTFVSRHSLTGSECVCIGYYTSSERRQGANANIQVLLDDWHLESDVYLHCHRGRETHQTSSIGEKRSAPSGDVSQSRRERNEAQNRSNRVVGKTYTHHQAVLKSVIHQKQVIADSSGQAATVWDLGG